MQRPAKPFTPVRFRLQPPSFMKKFILISGGFDPVHQGHLNLINDAAKIGKVIAIVNSDDFLMKKKGYVFMSQDQRFELIKSIKNVHDAFISIDKDLTVNKTIEKIVSKKEYKISYFANGGDRKTVEDVPEKLVCDKHGIELKFQVGGGKKESSSQLAENITKKILSLDGKQAITKKPWGFYQNFIYGDNYLLKKIVVEPNEALSYQSHKHRNEHWIVVKGKIEVKINKKNIVLNENDYMFIKKGSKHRMSNNYSDRAIIIEIQTGHILSEDDIHRFKDKYERG